MKNTFYSLFPTFSELIQWKMKMLSESLAFVVFFLIQLKKKKKTAYTTILLIQLQITVLKLERKEYTLTQCTPLLKTETVTELTSRFLLFIDKAQRQLQQA